MSAETDYKLHYQTEYQGIPVSIENRKGTVREGVDPDGTPWRVKMNYAYGRIPRTRGSDGDMLDCYLGPEKDTQAVYIIEQVDPDTGLFDEHKCMLGFATKADAVSGYKSQYTKSGFYGGCITKTLEEFKEWIKELTPAKTERRNIESRVANGVRVVDTEDGVKNRTQDLKVYGANGNIIEDEKIGFDALVAKLMKEGNSRESAQKIAYSIGKAKYGKKGMAQKSAAGRDADISETGRDALPDDNAALTVLQSSGAHTGADYSQFDQKELALGVLVELEHADSIPIAAEIAADHLVEKPDYYSDPQNPFLKEIMAEYAEPGETADGCMQDKSVQDALPILTEALLTPIVRSLMKNFGFKKLFWKGSGWSVPIGLGEYSTYLKKIPALKVFDRLLQKFGYEIHLSPLWFCINPVKK
jgi:hypothetical protein